ncbi:large ribosomal subunit protein bL19cz [Cornus florida]|uniref:large ribosomal subunit protein bL19cz n=1 Tax=Cornus florida TaxID=4283 RepID=UPI00289E0160|nr:large ribosomal subunit protein bL19cz [Cornus florida]
MGTNVLPQALFMMPRNPTQCSPKKLGLCAFVSHRPPSLNYTGIAISRVSRNQLGLSFDAFVAEVASSRSFSVRAESNSGGESETAESVDTETEPEPDSEVKLEVESESKPPRKPIVKLGDIMGILNKQAIEASEKERPVPDLRTGDIVEIKLEVPENRRRLSIYKGIVISKQNAGIHTTIRIRRIIAGIGVEIVFPVYSPNIKEIKVIKHRKVRRARLYYLRDKLPRLSTFK